MRWSSKYGFVALVVGLTTVIAVGCGEDSVPPPAPAPAVPTPAVPAAKAASPQPEEAAPATVPAVVVRRFTPQRDPFQSVFETRQRTEGPIVHPLQQYTIPQLKLLGIIWGIAKPVGLVAAPDGKEYVVRVGTPVGTGDGRVVAILPDRVVIVERYYDYRGQLQTEKYELTLPSEGSK